MRLLVLRFHPNLLRAFVTNVSRILLGLETLVLLAPRGYFRRTTTHSTRDLHQPSPYTSCSAYLSHCAEIARHFQEVKNNLIQ